MSLLFFFSSRRRHTRSLRDWSSDVCSSDLEFVARMRLVVCLGKRDGIASRLFHLNRGNEFVARMGLLVCPGKHGGIASRVFHITRNLGSGRVRSFRASLTLAALHNPTILTQMAQTESSARLTMHLLVSRIKYFRRGGHVGRPQSVSRHGAGYYH